jgi:hypothetical protein
MGLRAKKEGMTMPPSTPAIEQEEMLSRFSAQAARTSFVASLY